MGCALRLIFLLLLWLHVSLGYILRLPCKTYGNFSVEKSGFRLDGHVLVSLEVSTVELCEQHCLYHQSCSSINWKTPASGSANCQINEKSTENLYENVKLSPSSEWTYKTTDYRNTNVGELCRGRNPCPIGHRCTDSCSCPGFQCQNVTTEARSCKDLYDLGFRKSTRYDIYRPEIGIFPVRCDMATDGGGWIVFQRRVDNSVDFFRDWDAYKQGFGDMDGNFWLGLEKLHKLAALGKGAILRIDLKHMEFEDKKYAKYSLFEISGEVDGYRLKVGGYSGDAGDSLARQNNMKFSTKDKDQDTYRYNCAESFKGAWWYAACHDSNLNALHPSSGSDGGLAKYMSWKAIKNEYGKVTFSEMKVMFS
ncbi:ficolin-1-like [Rhopilema esculentum]|uniref:ficolin-1-like n=1 Tax=Rhopilema esculentum TaxID=499914 RepID=UPI0031E10CB4